MLSKKSDTLRHTALKLFAMCCEISVILPQIPRTRVQYNFLQSNHSGWGEGDGDNMYFTPRIPKKKIIMYYDFVIIAYFHRIEQPKRTEGKTDAVPVKRHGGVTGSRRISDGRR